MLLPIVTLRLPHRFAIVYVACCAVTFPRALFRICGWVTLYRCVWLVAYVLRLFWIRTHALRALHAVTTFPRTTLYLTLPFADPHARSLRADTHRSWYTAARTVFVTRYTTLPFTACCRLLTVHRTTAAFTFLPTFVTVCAFASFTFFVPHVLRGSLPYRLRSRTHYAFWLPGCRACALRYARFHAYGYLLRTRIPLPRCRFCCPRSFAHVATTRLRTALVAVVTAAPACPITATVAICHTVGCYVATAVTRIYCVYVTPATYLRLVAAYHLLRAAARRTFALDYVRVVPFVASLPRCVHCARA